MSRFKEFMDYWWPYSCEYESGWNTCCYNRLWYLLCAVDTILVAIVAPLLTIFAKQMPKIAWAGYMLVVVGLFAINLFQLCYLQIAYSEDCERLYEELIHGKAANKD